MPRWPPRWRRAANRWAPDCLHWFGSNRSASDVDGRRGRGDPALVFDTKGRPLLALVMATSPRSVGVARWNGSRWQGLASPEATHDLLPGDPAYGEGPAIALNAADQPVLVWPDGLELEARAFDGLRWIDLEFPAIPGTPRGAVVAVASPNAPVVAWSNVTASDRSEVFVLRRASEEWAEVGAHSATQEGISNTLPLSGAEGIGLCVDELGRITVAWTESLPYQASREVWVRQWDGQQCAEVGDGSAGDGGVPSCVNAATEPALACDGEGGLILAWAGRPERDPMTRATSSCAQRAPACT